MKAYEVKYGTKVRIVDEDVMIPVEADEVKSGEVITIFRLDGMYVNGNNSKGDRIYIHAMAEVEIVE